MKHTKLGGYAGRMLRVNLNDRSTSDFTPDESSLRMFLGGTGLAAMLLQSEVPPGTDPLAPENRLIFATGPLNGTRAPGSGSYSVVTKGPLTELAVAAQANGSFGAKMKFAGFDAVVIEGASDSPVLLELCDGQARLHAADHIAGRDCRETEEFVKDSIGDANASVACIGPSGEKMVKFAAIHNDGGHFAASGGVGAVMGSKGLKAIVARGRKEVPVAHRQEATELLKLWRMESMASPTGTLVSKLGTAGYFSAGHETGWLPVRNLTTNIFPEHPRFNGDYIRKNFRPRPHPCHSCPLTHCNTIEITEGPFAGLVTEEPEYEDLAGWGPNVGITDPSTAVKLTDVNDRLGLDVKEATFVISLAMECYEKGIITKADTDGIELTWGNSAAIMEILNKIAHREGFGNVLAEGVMRAAHIIGRGAGDLAVYVKKGIAPHVHDSRGLWGVMLPQSFGNMGSIDGRAMERQGDPDLGIPEPIPMFSAEMLPRAVARSSTKRQFEDCLVVCWFNTGIGVKTITDTVAAVTGWDFTPEEALEVGDRVGNLLRVFCIRHGLTPDGDSISPRLAKAPVDGPAAGISISPVYDRILRDYYRERGWDEQTGRPLRHTLSRLGLSQIADDMGT